MNSAGRQQTGQCEAVGASRERRLLIAAFVWALVSLSCITSTMLTEVIRNEDGTNRASLTFEIEIDRNVSDALEDLGVSRTGFFYQIAQQARAEGWQVQQEGERIVLSREFASLDELKQVPEAIAKLLDTDGPQAMKEMQVRVDESDPSLTKYEFLTTIEIPPMEEEEPSEPPVSDNRYVNLIVSFIGEVGEQATEDPKIQKLEEAAEAAGPPRLFIGVTLPGTIKEATVNDSPGRAR